MARDWSEEEVEATVSDYFAMLAKELKGEPFNKREHNRNLQALLDDRNAAAIEFKHQNISAVLVQLGFPYISGYKPAVNVQNLLRKVVAARLSSEGSLAASAEAFVHRPQSSVPGVADILSIVVPPPQREVATALYDGARSPGRSRSRNYLEEEARNNSLGVAGEEFILEFERERLGRAGQMSLSKRVEHVAKTRGDHVGYDIKSFETDGSDRLIEVKTTRLGELTPFFASANEVSVSRELSSTYQLYRLYRFEKHPRLYTLKGALEQTCTLDPVVFSALPS